LAGLHAGKYGKNGKNGKHGGKYGKNGGKNVAVVVMEFVVSPSDVPLSLIA